MTQAFGHMARTRVRTLLTIEGLAILVGVGILAAAFVPSRDRPAAFSEAVFVPTAMILILMVALGVYDPDARARYAAMRERLAVASLFGAAAAYLALYLFSPLWISPLYALAAASVAYGAAAAMRYVVMRSRTLARLQRRLILVGDSEGFARFDAMPGEKRDALRLTLEQAAEPGRLAAEIADLDAGEIVVAASKRETPLPVETLLDARMAGLRVIDLAAFHERETGRVDLANLYPQRFIFMETNAHTQIGRLLKRSGDLIVSGIALILLSPVLAGAALAVRRDSPGPALYRQTRVGLRGEPFEIVKFRSMRVDAEASGQPQWAGEADPRITKVGAFLRRTRIDELPQLWNVLKGEMSLVGPRPERPYFVGKLSETIPHYAERHRVKPGLTGWAQINYRYGATENDARVKLEYDLYYMKNASLALDVYILMKTARVVLWPDGVR
ncbi:TIGR03013 family XrtA/PEP-CTERM system glycosyltransferase [Neomegalonema perideroedes]|uniref:TIGR03013 family XrtA/PEP-CTERM system glycosyltransferase n=1 Tax=Neomegalonema perideroedes TaxID=217219 RepID=UPI0003671160|nr:TIGR03013 family XrtA/PEP-CTERM system glycosyltransferase [Neomegalonema perideroedes]